MADLGDRCILCVDRGSSSLKIAVYEVGHSHQRRLLEGGADRLGTPNAELSIRDERDPAGRETRRPLGDSAPLAAVLVFLHGLGVHVDAVGHRLVYGGLAHEAPARVTAELMTSLAALAAFDPLHLPNALAAIREIETSHPAPPQAVCFDTAFHRRMPPVAQRLPLPRELWEEGLRRYGFHGLSYESVVHALGEQGTRGRLIVAHLGSGASLAAIRDGRPIDTTMGFSPLSGLMMGTRPGDLDPGVLLFLLREGRYTSAELTDLLTDRSGLLGVSEISGDMQTLLERRADSPAAAEAVELFVYLAKKNVGALAAVLGGIDTLVFTGGMGEHAAPIRWEIAQGLAHLGVELDPARNAAGASVISGAGSRVVVRVVAADENLMIARHTYAALFGSPAEKAADESASARPTVVPAREKVLSHDR
jgi:acetate kinase